MKIRTIASIAAGFYIGGFARRLTDKHKGEAKSRINAARHVLKGKPTMYRMEVLAPPPPPLLHMSKTCQGALIMESGFVGISQPDAIRIEGENSWSDSWGRT